MKEHAINWDAVPDIITKDQLYRICHISKSTALYLLQSGKIPLRVHGQKNTLLQNQKGGCDCLSGKPQGVSRKLLRPCLLVQRRLYCSDGGTSSPIVQEHLRLYYTELLSGYHDVLTTQTVSKITGYGKTAINNWCNQGHIKSFRKNNVNHIPKVYLVEFFCSTYFRTVTRKSPWHIRTLQGFSSWRKIRDLHTADSEGGAE